MNQELVVDTNFFTSNFVPAVCLFSGESKGVQWLPLSIEYQGQSSNLLGISLLEIGAWRRQIVVPARRLPHFLWTSAWSLQLTSTLLAVAGAVVGLMGVRATLNGDADFAEPVLITIGVIFEALFIAVAMAMNWSARWRVEIIALPAIGWIKIKFPPSRQTIYNSYATYYQSYMSAELPPAGTIEKDEGWPDGVKPGWDEGRGK